MVMNNDRKIVLIEFKEIVKEEILIAIDSVARFLYDIIATLFY